MGRAFYIGPGFTSRTQGLSVSCRPPIYGHGPGAAQTPWGITRLINPDFLNPHIPHNPAYRFEQFFLKFSIQNDSIIRMFYNPNRFRKLSTCTDEQG